MSEESTTRNLEQQIHLGKSKVLEGHTQWVNSVFVKDNLIISGSYDKSISITPISLFPGELEVFEQVIDSYWLPRHIELEIMDYFIESK